MNPKFEEVKKLIQTHWLEEIKYPFMTNKILSSSPDTFVSAFKINELTRKINKQDYATLFNILVSKRNYAPYFHYPKKKRQENPKLVSKICLTFNVNKYHARQIIKIFESKKMDPAKIFGLKKGE